MTIGAGLAIAAILVTAAVIGLHKSVNGLGLTIALIAACFATSVIATH